MSQKKSVKTLTPVLACGFALALFCTAITQAETPDLAPTVATPLGALAGELQDGIRIFRGIPYAAAPVGELRWAPPQPVQLWPGLRDARQFGADCPTPAGIMPGNKDGARQLHGPNYDIWFGSMAPGGSEDCLTLNVWTPEQVTENAAVMVFFSPTGNGSVPFFDGSAFARDGVIFVSPNVRMFTQSVFAHPALTRTASVKDELRLQDLDRLAVLEWVRDNISAFGGDPNNVTVMGQSNSGKGILALLATTKAEGLFHRAIVQSGSSRTAPISYEGLEAIGAELASYAGLDGANATIEQLRALPIDALPFFVGMTAGRAEELNIAEAFARGHTLNVPLMIGGNTFDGSSLRYPAETIIANTPADVLDVYESEGLAGEALGYALYTDGHVNAPARWMAAAQARRGAPVYHYVYSHVSSFRKNQPGAGHGDELLHVFDTFARIGLAKYLSDTDRKVTNIMHDCWVAFARSGRPQCAGAPEWPTYDAESNWTMELSAAPQLHQHYRKAQYDAHDRDKSRNLQHTQDGNEVIAALRAAR